MVPASSSGLDHVVGSLRFGVAFPAWAPNETAGRGAGVLAVLQDLNPVHKDMRHPGGIPARLFEGGVVGDCLGIKHDDIGEVALLQAATVSDFQVGGGEGGQPPDGLLERDDLFIPREFPSTRAKLP